MEVRNGGGAFGGLAQVVWLCLAPPVALAQQVKVYTDTSLTACPAGETLRYFWGTGYGDIPQVRGGDWCAAANAVLQHGASFDPYPDRLPYQIDACVAGSHWHYSHSCGGPWSCPGPSGDGRYHSVSWRPAGHRGINLVCGVGGKQIELIGGSATRALPAGPALVITARVTQGGAPRAGEAVSITAGGRGSLSGVTDGAGEYRFSVIPYEYAEVIPLTASYGDCENTASKSIVVEAPPAPQDPPGTGCTADSVGNPLVIASGEKRQPETDHDDAGAQPLHLTRLYLSGGQVAAGLGAQLGWPADRRRQPAPAAPGRQHPCRVHPGRGRLGGSLWRRPARCRRHRLVVPSRPRRQPVAVRRHGYPPDGGAPARRRRLHAGL